MTKNTTRFRIELWLSLWRIIDPAADKEVAHSSTWELAVKAAKAIEAAETEKYEPTFRESLRLGHLLRVLEAREWSI